MPAEPVVLLRGGGDLGSGSAVRLARCGFQVLITESSEPQAVRRTVSFSEAVYSGSKFVEEVEGILIGDASDAEKAWAKAAVAIVVDPELAALPIVNPAVLVDATMRKRVDRKLRSLVPRTIGLGPGFVAGESVNAVVETNRGPDLGRVIWSGPASANTGIPSSVGGYASERVLRAPATGILETSVEIGDVMRPGDGIGVVQGTAITAPFEGLVRGLLRDGSSVTSGQKIGDMDPRLEPELCTKVSDKALAVAGGVLEATLRLLRTT